MKSTLNKGFTLVEMSIVMLILALLTGGILIGKDLMHASEIRATVKQAEMFNLAYNTFQLKYNCWPGDCRDAPQMGFTDDFSIYLSKNETQPEDNFFEAISPISTAHALLVTEQIISVDGNLIPDGQGGLINQLTGKTPTTKGKVVPLSGDNNCFIENNMTHSLMEGSTGIHMLTQSNMIAGLDYKTRVYLKLSSAFATIGKKTLPAFWVVGNLTPGVNGQGLPSIIDTPGAYLQIIASFQPFAAASLPVKDSWYIDTKIDDGTPLGGTVRSSSTAQTNLVLGPTYSEDRDVSLNSCLVKTESDDIAYNAGSSDVNAKCAQVIRLNIGGCGGG